MTPVAESGGRETIACPRCAAPVGAEQDWCLACGDAARTRLVPTPNWHAPVALVAVVAILAGVGLALAFVALTDDSGPAAPPAATTGAPQPTTPTPTAPPGATTAPGVNTATTAPTTPTTSPGTTTAPGTTATTPTAPGG